MNRASRIAGAAAVVVLLGVGGYMAADAAGFLKKTGPLSEDEVRSASEGFLAAWAEGDIGEAADLTDDGQSALTALDGFRKELGQEVTLKAAERRSTTVAFSVSVRLEGGGARSVWTYDSELKVVRDEESGEPRVDWSPGVVHPRLASGDRLTLVEDDALSVAATDRDGRELTVDEFPSLASVLPDLAKRYGDILGGEPGVEVRVTGRDGRTGPPLHVVSEGKRAELRTTLSAERQRAAERAVKKYPRSSAVAVEPSSGEILAVANNREDGFNAAFLGNRAPGSTMKIVTAAALLEKDLVSASGPAPCPKVKGYGGATFQNLDKFEIDGGTFSDAFIRSCNTTFVGFADRVGSSGLAEEAKEVFGLGLEWHSGVATFDGRVPEADGPERAASMIGQGKVQVNALNMASVAATASTGTFRQPILVALDLDGRSIAEAKRSLPDDVTEQLRAMMRRTATEGTAAEAMRGLPGDIGAKTGSAEVDGAETSDSWFTGFRDDTAAAATVEAGGHGGDAAGPIVRDILAAGD
ncbi:penicillin-binding transpeptidase domain-containing protein [Streptomyces sp. AC558_RSS880]|uniref:penicillin-binding transpeptidase domain-containing protein n=1 Tax=Streptomyces sp. AC558_RSS880 TaxID=2823687 RepID=UPI0027E3C2D5|nr:penicillin-binding transpeptidase domain-containing protein [Streptomyces sp. AC558_RSS880]